MRFRVKGLIVFIIFAGALAFTFVPEWGVLAVSGFLLIELFLTLGIAGFGRGGEAR
jgi:hypothetical protein